MSIPAEAAAPAVVSREIPFEFRATGAEYFRIWIVNLLLTIVTLGIYSAWAKVRRLRYFYGSTSLDNAAFEYHGSPIAILKGRLIAFGIWLVFFVAAQLVPILFLLLVPLAIFGLPWIIQRSRLFQMRMSSYRGLRFNFHGTYGGALGAYIGWAILAAITFYLLVPGYLWRRVNYLLGNAAYGTERFRFTTPINRFYGFCLVTLGLMLIVVLLLLVFGRLDPLAAGAPFDLAMLPYFLLLAVLALGATGYFQSSFINASFGGLKIGPHRVRSTLRPLPLIGIYVTNLLLIVVTLGLAYPWAKVRQMRYQLANMSVLAEGDLDQFRAAAGQGTDAVGEEIGDFFDIDFGL